MNRWGCLSDYGFGARSLIYPVYCNLKVFSLCNKAVKEEVVDEENGADYVPKSRTTPSMLVRRKSPI